MRRLAGASAMALAIAVVVAACGGGSDEPTQVEPNPRYATQPNFLFILTDDQNLAQFNRRTMPNTFKLLVDPGTTFTNYYVATPLCCPSRATMLTGQYGHNNGILANVPGYSLLEEPENILPAWLKRVGYKTAEVGKWLNGYEKTVDKHKEEPPGWDKWHGLIGAHGYFDFKASNNGNKDVYDHGPYLTNWIGRTAVDVIRKLSDEPDPWYLQVNELAPHVENFLAESNGHCAGEAVPAPRDAGSFAGAGLPDSPSINERDVADKPSFVAGKDRLTREQLELLAVRYQCRLESLRSLDRTVARMVRALGVAGELKDTVVIFASDNGTFHGEHRLPGGKGLPYDEAAHMPLVIRAPDEFRGGRPVVPEVDVPASNVDLVPTIVDLAGAPTCISDDECRVMDGRSWVPLLGGNESEWPRNRPLLQELDLNVDALDIDRGISCKFSGVRYRKWLYIEHTEVPAPGLGSCVENTVVEQYDTARDPYQLENLSGPRGPAGARARAAAARMARLTAELSDCAGIKGRDPEPDSGHYCS